MHVVNEQTVGPSTAPSNWHTEHLEAANDIAARFQQNYSSMHLSILSDAYTYNENRRREQVISGGFFAERLLNYASSSPGRRSEGMWCYQSHLVTFTKYLIAGFCGA